MLSVVNVVILANDLSGSSGGVPAACLLFFCFYTRNLSFFKKAFVSKRTFLNIHRFRVLKLEIMFFLLPNSVFFTGSEAFQSKKTLFVGKKKPAISSFYT